MSTNLDLIWYMKNVTFHTIIGFYKDISSIE